MPAATAILPVCYQRDIIRRPQSAVRNAFSAATVKGLDAKIPTSPQLKPPTYLQRTVDSAIQGNAAGQTALLLSFDAVRGNVIHLTSNFLLSR